MKQVSSDYESRVLTLRQLARCSSEFSDSLDVASKLRAASVHNSRFLVCKNVNIPGPLLLENLKNICKLCRPMLETDSWVSHSVRLWWFGHGLGNNRVEVPVPAVLKFSPSP